MAETINYMVKHVILFISTYSMNEPQSSSLIDNYTVCVLYNTDSVLLVEYRITKYLPCVALDFHQR